MKSDLDTLKTEIDEYLGTQDIVVFHGFPRLGEPTTMVHWDSAEYPDYRQFLDTAKRLGVQLIVFHHRHLAPEFIEDALDRLDGADMPDDEYIEVQRRLRELRVYEGFTSAVELSYEYQGRIYFFGRRAEWYEELLDIADEIDDFGLDEEPDDEEFSEPEDDIGPYFTKN